MAGFVDRVYGKLCDATYAIIGYETQYRLVKSVDALRFVACLEAILNHGKMGRYYQEVFKILSKLGKQELSEDAKLALKELYSTITTIRPNCTRTRCSLNEISPEEYFNKVKEVLKRQFPCFSEMVEEDNTKEPPKPKASCLKEEEKGARDERHARRIALEKEALSREEFERMQKENSDDGSGSDAATIGD